MSPFLIIDTSTERSLVAISSGVDLLFKEELPFGYQSSRHIMKVIEASFQKVETLSAIAVAIGPGSYTGIRVGVAAAQGLSIALAVPLIGFCSLLGYVSSDEGQFASVIDAKRGGAYVLLQERKEGIVRVLGEPMRIPKEELNALGCPLIEIFNIHFLAQVLREKIAKKEYLDDRSLELIYLNK